MQPFSCHRASGSGSLTDVVIMKEKELVSSQYDEDVVKKSLSQDLLNDVLADEKYYARIINDLADVIQAVASPREVLNIPENRLHMLETLSEVREHIQDIRKFILECQ